MKVHLTVNPKGDNMSGVGFSLGDCVAVAVASRWSNGLGSESAPYDWGTGRGESRGGTGTRDAMAAACARPKWAPGEVSPAWNDV